ncbi:MAG: PHP domain-containing protein, partial [Anaerolineae bacterium]|nr:PHP domain-containing protein [Anaerolineae bacterium]
MGQADLHLHTTFSDGVGTVEAVLEAARRAGLDIIAITDHDTLQGAWRACDLGPRYG